jgi:acetylglutamate kinase
MPQTQPQLDTASILTQAMPYIQRLQGKTIVVKYGGNAMTDVTLQAAFAKDIVMLKLLGLNPVVVHGGGPQIELALNKIGKQGQFIQGMRVTDDETMQVVEWVLGGEVQQAIVGLINHAGGNAVGLTGRDGGMVRAKKLQLVDSKDANVFHDVGNVGDIEAVNPTIVRSLQAAGFIPVVSPIGFGANNEPYNINADLVAGKLAEVLNAETLLLLTNISGVLDKQKTLLTTLNAARIADLLADETISGGMIPKVASALEAAQNGVGAVHIADGRVPHAVLLSLLTNQAVGTVIRAK